MDIPDSFSSMDARKGVVTSLKILIWHSEDINEKINLKVKSGCEYEKKMARLGKPRQQIQGEFGDLGEIGQTTGAIA